MSRPTTATMTTMTTTMPTTTATTATSTTTSTTKRPSTSTLSSTAASTTVSKTSSTSTVRSTTVTTQLRTTKNVVLQVSLSTPSLLTSSTTSTSNPITTTRKPAVTSTQTTTSTMTTSSMLTTTARVLQCPPQIQRSRNVREYGGHCYEFILGVHKEWPAAEHDCNLRGGHLVSVGSQGEQDFVYHSLGVLQFHGDNGVWIGLTDQQHEGHWTWSSGERVAFTYWASGQPGIFGSLEDCALMDMNKNGHWGDYSCDGILFLHHRHGYVCEYNKI